jgi:secondary thiamine-phosphate synthase enzyme
MVMVRGKTISLKTKGDSDIHDITREVQGIVSESGIREGIVVVSAIGSTASVSTIEFEPALVADMRDKLNEFAAKSKRTRHGDTWGDDNGYSHLRATFMGPSVTVPVTDARPVLGTWQQIVVIDHDNRPRDRRVFVQVMGE